LDIASALASGGTLRAATVTIRGGRPTLSAILTTGIGAVQVEMVTQEHLYAISDAMAQRDRQRVRDALIAAARSGAIFLVVHRANKRLASRGEPRLGQEGGPAAQSGAGTREAAPKHEARAPGPGEMTAAPTEAPTTVASPAQKIAAPVAETAPAPVTAKRGARARAGGLLVALLIATRRGTPSWVGGGTPDAAAPARVRSGPEGFVKAPIASRQRSSGASKSTSGTAAPTEKKETAPATATAKTTAGPESPKAREGIQRQAVERPVDNLGLAREGTVAEKLRSTIQDLQQF